MAAANWNPTAGEVWLKPTPFASVIATLETDHLLLTHASPDNKFDVLSTVKGVLEAHPLGELVLQQLLNGVNLDLKTCRLEMSFVSIGLLMVLRDLGILPAEKLLVKQESTIISDLMDPELICIPNQISEIISSKIWNCLRLIQNLQQHYHGVCLVGDSQNFGIFCTTASLILSKKRDLKLLLVVAEHNWQLELYQCALRKVLGHRYEGNKKVEFLRWRNMASQMESIDPNQKMTVVLCHSEDFYRYDQIFPNLAQYKPYLIVHHPSRSLLKKLTGFITGLIDSFSLADLPMTLITEGSPNLQSTKLPTHTCELMELFWPSSPLASLPHVHLDQVLAQMTGISDAKVASSVFHLESTLLASPKRNIASILHNALGNITFVPCKLLVCLFENTNPKVGFQVPTPVQIQEITDTLNKLIVSRPDVQIAETQFRLEKLDVLESSSWAIDSQPELPEYDTIICLEPEELSPAFVSNFRHLLRRSPKRVLLITSGKTFWFDNSSVWIDLFGAYKFIPDQNKENSQPLKCLGCLYMDKIAYFDSIRSIPDFLCEPLFVEIDTGSKELAIKQAIQLETPNAGDQIPKSEIIPEYLGYVEEKNHQPKLCLPSEIREEGSTTPLADPRQSSHHRSKVLSSDPLDNTLQNIFTYPSNHTALLTPFLKPQRIIQRRAPTMMNYNPCSIPDASPETQTMDHNQSGLIPSPLNSPKSKTDDIHESKPQLFLHIDDTSSTLKLQSPDIPDLLTYLTKIANNSLDSSQVHATLRRSRQEPPYQPDPHNPTQNSPSWPTAPSNLHVYSTNNTSSSNSTNKQRPQSALYMQFPYTSYVFMHFLDLNFTIKFKTLHTQSIRALQLQLGEGRGHKHLPELISDSPFVTSLLPETFVPQVKLLQSGYLSRILIGALHEELLMGIGLLALAPTFLATGKLLIICSEDCQLEEFRALIHRAARKTPYDMRLVVKVMAFVDLQEMNLEMGENQVTHQKLEVFLVKHAQTKLWAASTETNLPQCAVLFHRVRRLANCPFLKALLEVSPKVLVADLLSISTSSQCPPHKKKLSVMYPATAGIGDEALTRLMLNMAVFNFGKLGMTSPRLLSKLEMFATNPYSQIHDTRVVSHSDEVIKSIKFFNENYGTHRILVFVGPGQNMQNLSECLAKATNLAVCTLDNASQVRQQRYPRLLDSGAHSKLSNTIIVTGAHSISLCLHSVPADLVILLGIDRLEGQLLDWMKAATCTLDFKLLIMQTTNRRSLAELCKQMRLSNHSTRRIGASHHRVPANPNSSSLPEPSADDYGWCASLSAAFSNLELDFQEEDKPTAIRQELTRHSKNGSGRLSCLGGNNLLPAREPSLNTQKELQWLGRVGELYTPKYWTPVRLWEWGETSGKVRPDPKTSMMNLALDLNRIQPVEISDNPKKPNFHQLELTVATKKQIDTEPPVIARKSATPRPAIATPALVQRPSTVTNEEPTYDDSYGDDSESSSSESYSTSEIRFSSSSSSRKNPRQSTAYSNARYRHILEASMARISPQPPNRLGSGSRSPIPIYGLLGKRTPQQPQSSCFPKRY